MKPLLSPSQLTAFQRTALTSLATPVVIKRPVTGSDDLGDDVYDANPAVVVQPDSVLRSGVLYGFIRQTSGDNVGGIDLGRVQTTSTLELGLPIGTDVLTRDIAVIEGLEFIVNDVLNPETWRGMLNCTLRFGT